MGREIILNLKEMRVAATFKLRKRRLIHKTQAKACGYQLQKEKITFDIT